MLWSQGPCSACISTGLSGVGFGLRWLEEGVRQLPEPHGHGLGHVGRLGVHDGVEKRLQVGLRVPPNVHDLVSGGGGLRRRLGPRGCRLPRPGRRAMPLGGLRRRLPLALGGWLRRRLLLPGIHGFCLPRRAPRLGGQRLHPGAPARRVERGEAARAVGQRRERRSPRSQGRGAAPRPRIPRPGASAPALRPGSTGPAAEPREGLPETRTCSARELFSFTPLTDAGQLVAFPLPLSLLFPFRVPSFLPFFSPAAAAPD